MEEMPVSALNTLINGVTASEDYYGHCMSPDLSGVPGHAIVFSYAPPDMVRQAKLEALKMKVHRKMLERKVSLVDTHALSNLRISDLAPPTVRISARTNAVGSRELVKSLVVPPQLTEHGEEVCGTSEFILDGERREYQRPGRVLGSASQAGRPMPRYRTYEPGQGRTSTDDQKKKKAWGGSPDAGEQTGQKDELRSGGGAAGANESHGTSVRRRTPRGGFKGKGAALERSELNAQLSEGMLTYVPSKFERPKGVESTAFVPQGQAMAEARNKYESVKQRRPASAPPRRAIAARVNDGDDTLGTGRTMPSDHGVGSNSSSGLGAGNGATARDKKWMDVPVVVPEETDLLAVYRQSSQQQERQDGAATSRTTSLKLRGASAQSLSPRVNRSVAALQPGHVASSADNGRKGAAAAQGPQRKDNIGSTPSGPNILAPKKKLQTADAAAKVRSRPTSAVPMPGASRNPTQGADTKPPARAPNATKLPIAPATAMEAASMAASAASKPWASRPVAAASAWEGRRPASPNRTPVPSRPTSQRRIALLTAPGSGTGGEAPAPGMHVGLQPLDPETRRQRQNRPGSAISTAKTNRLRGSFRGLGGAAGFDGGGPHATWTTSSDPAPTLCDRMQLQERILGGLIRQITISPDDEDDDSSSNRGEAATAVDGAAQWRPGRLRTASDTASSGAGFGVSPRSGVMGHVDPRQQYQPSVSSSSHPGSRPHSAPNRRLRPPSPGHWAGRPDPDTLLARTAALQHSTTGIVYDPEMQPSPLDSYTNQLHGLD